MDAVASWYHVYNSTTGKWLHERRKWGVYSGAQEFADRESAEKFAKRAPQDKDETIIVLGDFGIVE